MSNTTDGQLRIAIQKSGRLNEGSVSLLRECGIEVSNGGSKLRAVASNFPLEVLFLRDDDIPQYVQDGVADAGIVGQNILLEKQSGSRELETLGFGHCRLSIAVPKSFSYDGIASLNGSRFATSYPNLLENFLSKNGIEGDIHHLNGSVEIAPGIGLADAVCDLVSSGSTLLANGLKEAEVIMQSEAVLIAGENLPEARQALLEKLLFRIQAVKKSKRNKYILLNAPNEKIPAISRIIPGMKSPTVLPLAESGWSSVHSVVQEDHFWDIIEDLKANGAQGILVVPIEKMIM